MMAINLGRNKLPIDYVIVSVFSLFSCSHTCSSDNGFLGISLWTLQGKIWKVHSILTCLVITKKKRKNRFWHAALVKNQHKMHNNREFACKRGVSLANPRRKNLFHFRVQTPFMKILLQISFILHQCHFHANEVKFYAFLKFHIF